MKKWLNAFRLRTLPLSLSTIILGGACAHWSLKGTDFNWFVFSLAILTTILLQILSNLANDYGDFEKGTDNDERIGPKRTMQAGLISKRQMQIALGIFVGLSLVSGINLLWFSFSNFNLSFLILFFIGIGAIAAAMKYTMGKSAYGYRGLGDVFVFIFFGIVGVLGTYFLLTNKLDPFILLPASSMGLFATAVLNLNNMRDHVNDKKAGKNTIVVLLGIKSAKVYHYLLFIMAYASLLFFLIVQIGGVNFLLIVPFMIFHGIHLEKVRIVNNPEEFDPFLKTIALSTFALSLLISISIFTR